jgi:hypothetical protein
MNYTVIVSALVLMVGIIMAPSFTLSTSQLFAEINTWKYEDNSYLEMVNKYCLDHVDRILEGGNPVKDLIDAGLLTSTSYNDMTCKDVQAMKEIYDSVNSFFGDGK